MSISSKEEYLQEMSIQLIEKEEIQNGNNSELETNDQNSQQNAKIIQDEIFSKKTRNSKNICGFILLVISFGIYISISELCPEVYTTDEACVSQFLFPNINKWTIKGILSSLIFVSLLYLSFYRVISRFFIILLFAMIAYIVFIQDNKITMRDYTQLIQIFYLIFISVTIIIFTLIFICIQGAKKFKWWCSLIAILGILLLFILFYKLIDNSCDTWGQGLRKEKINISNQYCTLEKPTICWLNILDGLFDSTFFCDCTKREFNKEEKQTQFQILSQYFKIPNDINYLIYPRTEYFTSKMRCKNNWNFQLEVLKQYSFAKNESQISNISEAVLDLKSMSLKLNLIKNQNLQNKRLQQFQERQLLIKKNMPQNIIILYVDSISREMMMRKLKKALNWFEMKSYQGSHAFFQSFRYLSLSLFTYHNYMAYEYGIVSEEKSHILTANWSNSKGYNDQFKGPINKKYLKRQPKRWRSITQDLQDAGYIVAKARSQCSNSVVDHDPGFEIFVNNAPPDHELASIMCDPNYQNPKNLFGPYQGPYSTLRRCLYGREVNEYVFDYGRQFLKAYAGSPKYLELQFLEAHESSGEHSKYLDKPMESFLQWLDQEKLVKFIFDQIHQIENSMIMIVSDHGLHIHALYELLNVQNYKQEMVLPGMFILIDRHLINENQELNLKANQQKAMTYFEVHYLMKFFISDDSLRYDQDSILSDEIQDNRDCNDVPITIDQPCFCFKKQNN